MNNRYLFKAKRKNWRELPKEDLWVQGALFDGESHCIIESEIKISTYVANECKVVGYEVDRSTICQCTGTRDKAKNLIWENDVVEYYGIKGVIRFGEFGSNALKNIGFYVEWRRGYYRQDLGYWFGKINVIGSMIDNPELLEVK